MKGTKAWAALKDVHAPATAAVAVVLERQMAALRIEEDELVEEGVQKFFDLLTRLEGADLNYSGLQKKTKLLALLAESWSSLIINLNRDLPRLLLEDVKRAILQEDFRCREVASADGAGAASIGKGYGLGRGRGRGRGRFGSNNFNGGRGSGGFGSDNKSYGRGRGRFDGECHYCHKSGHMWRDCFNLPDRWTPAQGQEGRRTRGWRGRGRGGRGGRGGGAANMKNGDNKSKSTDNRFSGQIFFVSTQTPAAPEKDEGFEELAAVRKVNLHSLDYWVIDSGATYSMTPRADLLTELEPSPVKHVTSALGQRAEVKGMGKAMFKGADGKMVGLKNQILVVPMFKERQVAASVSTKGEAVGSGYGVNDGAKANSNKCKPGGTSKQCELEESGVAPKKQHKGEENPKAATEEYRESMLGTIASAAFSNPTSATGECGWLTLHRRMGHVALPILQQLVKNEMVAGIRVKGEPDEVLGCPTCMQAKFTRFPFSSSEATAKAPLDEVVMDVVGPVKLGAVGAEYFLTIVDVFTRMTCVCVLSKKSDVAETVKTDWLPMVERQQDRLGAMSALAGAAMMVGDDEESAYEGFAFAFFSPMEMPGEPTTLKEALESSDFEEWKKAMESELKSIEENGTWELVELPEGRKAITSKWLFKIKSEADGKIERYKSRLVAKGYHQKEKVDYMELFALVVKATALRTLLAGATIKGWVVKKMDVTTAFLNGVLEEEILMAQPEGFDDGSGRVWKLKKALYGLKQAPRQWYLKLREVLEEIGFTPSSADHSLFMLGEGEQRSFMVVYVDDILIFSPSSDLVKEVMLKLQDKFKCKALGDVSFYLGLHNERDVEKRCMRVHQRKYLEALAANFGQIECHVATPFPSRLKCMKGPEEESVGEEERCRFHSLVGSLIGTKGAGAASPGGARTRGTRATGAGGVGGAGAGDLGAGGAGAGGTGARGTGAGGAGAGGTGAGGTGAGGAGAGGAGAGDHDAGGAGAVDPGDGGVGAGGAASSGTSAGGTVERRPFSVPPPPSSLPPPDSVLRQVLSLPSSTGLPPSILSPPPRQSQPQLQPDSPRPAPSPYAEQTKSFTERREPESCLASPVCAAHTGRRVPRPRPPPVLGTHVMALCPSSVPQRVPLPSPLASSLLAVPDPESDLAHAGNPTVPRLLPTVVTDPSFESTAASALVAELVDFAAACRLDYATSLVAESESDCPPSVGGECALGTDVLEDRQEDFECLAAAVPHLVAMLLAPEGDPDAPNIPTPRSYAEPITGPYSSQWQTVMDAEMASWKFTGIYIDAVPPSGANIVDGMWIFRVKRPPGSLPVSET
ncbi:unnamed protein product [Closterium sp. NIES-54]